MTDEASKRGRASRRKGHSFEREVAALLRELWPDAKRGLQSRGGTKEVPDIDGTPFFFELKRGKKTNIKAALAQADAACHQVTETGTVKVDTRPPIAICKDDRQKATVTMYLDDFMELMRRFYS